MKLAAVKGAVDRHEAVASRHQLTVDGSRQPRSSSDIADELMGLPVGRTHSPDTVGLPVGDEQTCYGMLPRPTDPTIKQEYGPYNDGRNDMS